MNQCKDCKWGAMTAHEKNHLRCHFPINKFVANCHHNWSQVETFLCGEEPALYVLPTHGCNAWEAKGQKK